MALVLGVTGAWALIPPDPLPLPTSQTIAASGRSDGNDSSVTPDAWRVSLWRAFSDAPPPPPPAAAPLTLKIFSILRQADGITAAIDPGTGAGLVYAKVGERVGPHTVTAIDDRGIEVETDGRRQRVELRP
jgi:hypothetical protein